MNNSRETQDFERWIIGLFIRYGQKLGGAKVVEANPPTDNATPEHIVQPSNMIQGVIVDSSIEKEK